MGVNSAFKGFFNQRWLLGSGLALVMPGIFFIAASFTKPPDRELQSKQVNLILRQIGDRLLLQAGDSTSRVLPVTEIKEGTFLLKFENNFVFNHDSLMMLSLALLPKTQFPSGYSVTVHDCMNADIVYGFQVNTIAPDILACSGRRQPTGCYMIEFAFHDFYDNVETKKTDIGPLTEERNAVSVDPPEANPKPEEVTATATSDHGIDQSAEEPNVFQADPREANRKPDEFKATTFLYPLNNLVFSGMLVLLGAGVTLLIGRFGKILIPVPVQHQNRAIINESVPELPGLGKFQFDVKDQRLLLGSEVISLTDKECKILELLNKDFGELIPRETLMQKVWINEGVITGRSLDMFVSKLRKKLSSDPELRITNVHGKGYKLEIPGI